MRTKMMNLGYRCDVTIRRQRTWAASSQWVMLGTIVVFGALANLLFPFHASITIMTPMGAALGIAMVGGIRRSGHKRAWNLIAAGVIAYVLGDLLGVSSSVLATSQFASVSYLAAYAGFAAGFTAFIFRRR